MESINSEKGYSDEQWEALLNQTFGDPAPAPKAPEPPESKSVPQTPPAPPSQPASNPETPKDTSAPVKPVTKKKRKAPKVLWILLAVSLVIAIIAIHVLPRDENDTVAITEEQKQCMEALRQWQSTQYYKMDINTYHMTGTNLVGSSSIMYERPTENAIYYQGEEIMLYWCYSNHRNLNSYSDYYTGKAQIADELFTYSSSQLTAAQWSPATDNIPTPIPWIMTYSLDDVQILHQDVQHDKMPTGQKLTYITIAVMDTNQKSPFYRQGPYHIRFFFREDQLYAIAHLQTDFNNTDLIATYFNLYELSAEDVVTLIKSQMRVPQRYPGLSFDSTVPD